MTIGRYLLLGAGDLAREVAKILMRNAEFSGSIYEIAAFSDFADRVSPEFDRFCVTPADALREYPPSDWQAIACVGNPKLREKLYTQFRKLGYGFATACDRDATVFAQTIGPGCVVFPGACLAVGCQLAEDVVVNFNVSVGHDTVIGPHSVVNPGVQLAGRIMCGQRVLFGIGSTVLPRKTIGDDAVISAGSAVWGDVPERCTMIGVPARMFRGHPPAV